MPFREYVIIRLLRVKQHSQSK